MCVCVCVWFVCLGGGVVVVVVVVVFNGLYMFCMLTSMSRTEIKILHRRCDSRSLRKTSRYGVALPSVLDNS